MLLVTVGMLIDSLVNFYITFMYKQQENMWPMFTILGCITSATGG